MHPQRKCVRILTAHITNISPRHLLQSCSIPQRTFFRKEIRHGQCGFLRFCIIHYKIIQKKDDFRRQIIHRSGRHEHESQSIRVYNNALQKRIQRLSALILRGLAFCHRISTRDRTRARSRARSRSNRQIPQIVSLIHDNQMLRKQTPQHLILRDQTNIWVRKTHRHILLQSPVNPVRECLIARDRIAIPPVLFQPIGDGLNVRIFQESQTLQIGESRALPCLPLFGNGVP